MRIQHQYKIGSGDSYIGNNVNTLACRRGLQIKVAHLNLIVQIKGISVALNFYIIEL